MFSLMVGWETGPLAAPLLPCDAAVVEGGAAVQWVARDTSKPVGGRPVGKAIVAGWPLGVGLRALHEGQRVEGCRLLPHNSRGEAGEGHVEEVCAAG